MTLKQTADKAHKELTDLVEKKWRGRDALREKHEKSNLTDEQIYEEQEAYYAPLIAEEDILTEAYFATMFAYVNSEEYTDEYLRNIEEYKEDIVDIDALLERLKELKPEDVVTIGEPKRCWESQVAYAVETFSDLKVVYQRKQREYTMRDVHILYNNPSLRDINKKKLYKGN